MKQKGQNSKVFKGKSTDKSKNLSKLSQFISRRDHERGRMVSQIIKSNIKYNSDNISHHRVHNNFSHSNSIEKIIKLIPRRNPPNPTQTAGAASVPENKNIPFLHTMKRHVSWLTVQTQSQPEPPSLGREIVEFTKYIMLHEDEVSCRNEIIQDMKDVVSAKWPHPVTVQTFGSYHSGLSIFLSDIDISIVGFQPQYLSSAKELKKDQVKKLDSLYMRGLDYVREYELRRYARVPIISFIHRNGICCDISCGVLAQDTTDHVNKLQVNSGFAFFPLSCVLKIFLHQFRLDEPYLGGIGSFKLYVMVAHIIQKYKLHKKQNNRTFASFDNTSHSQIILKSNFTDDDCESLSYLLLDFFHYYSQPSNFNINTTIKVFDTEVTFEACRLVDACRMKFQKAYSVLYSIVTSKISNSKISNASNSHQISNSILSHIIFAESLQQQRNEALQNCQLHRPVSLDEKNRIAQNILNEIISRNKHIVLSDEFKSGVTVHALENVNRFASLKLKSYRTVESFFQKPAYTTGASAATVRSVINSRSNIVNSRHSNWVDHNGSTVASFRELGVVGSAFLNSSSSSSSSSPSSSMTGMKNHSDDNINIKRKRDDSDYDSEDYDDNEYIRHEFDYNDNNEEGDDDDDDDEENKNNNYIEDNDVEESTVLDNVNDGDDDYYKENNNIEKYFNRNVINMILKTFPTCHKVINGTITESVFILSIRKKMLNYCNSLKKNGKNDKDAKLLSFHYGEKLEQSRQNSNKRKKINRINNKRKKNSKKMKTK